MDAFYTIDDFRPARSIGYLIRRAAKLATAQVEARFSDCELTTSHWMALAFVRYTAADSCAKLARQLGHDSGATTRLVDQLEERGLVRRHRAGSDRRVVTVEVTPAGDDQLEALTPRVIDHWNHLLTGFTRDEANMLIGLMSRVVDALEAAETAGVDA